MRVRAFAKPEGKKKLRIETFWLTRPDGKTATPEPLVTTSYIYFTPNGPNDWHVVQSVCYPVVISNILKSFCSL